MSQVSMTIPESLRDQCMVDGARINLTPKEAELLALVLTTPPNHVAEYEMLIEGLWPDPDTQALTATNILSVLSMRLRKKGVPIKTIWGRGFTIQEEARGGRPVRRDPVLVASGQGQLSYLWEDRRAA